MSGAIIKIKDKYFVWSSVVDAPISDGLTLEELRKHLKTRGGLDEFEARVKRADETGTSYLDGSTLTDIERCNRAGPNEKRVTLNQIYEIYRHP